MARRVRKAEGQGEQHPLPLKPREAEDRSSYPECVLCGEVEPVGCKMHSGKYDGSVHKHCYERVEGRH